MKYCFITLYAMALICLSQVSMAQDRDTINFGTTGIVPEWVRSRLTEDQFVILKKISQRYKSIDYRIFKRRDLDSAGISYMLNQTYSDSLNREKALGTDLVFYPLNLSKDLTVLDRLDCYRVGSIVYSSIEGYDVHVVINAKICKESNIPEVIDWQVEVKSFSGIPVRMEKDEWDTKNVFFEYNSIQQRFDGYVSCRLYYEDPYGKEHREEVSENFTIDYDPDQLK